MAKIQIVVRTYPEGYFDDGVGCVNDFLRLGCKVVSVNLWYDKKGRIMGNEYILEGERKEKGGEAE